MTTDLLLTKQDTEGKEEPTYNYMNGTEAKEMMW